MLGNSPFGLLFIDVSGEIEALMAALRCGRHRSSVSDGDGLEFRTPDAGRQRPLESLASEFFVCAGSESDDRLISGKNEAYYEGLYAVCYQRPEAPNQRGRTRHTIPMS